MRPQIAGMMDTRSITAFNKFLEPRVSRLRDVETGRIGVYTGEQQTCFPPNYGVRWEDDKQHGYIRARSVELVK